MDKAQRFDNLRREVGTRVANALYQYSLQLEDFLALSPDAAKQARGIGKTGVKLIKLAISRRGLNPGTWSEKGTKSLEYYVNVLRSRAREEIAGNAAAKWCRCFKCDGIVNETGMKCEKPGATCWKWGDAYHGALLALDDNRIKL